MRRRALVAVSACILAAVAFVSVRGCHSGKSTDELIAALKSHDEKDRLIAVRQLPQKKRDAAKVVPALIEALKDPEGDVRLSAAIGLGYFGDQARDAVPALQVALRDRDPRVREAAGVALTRIDPELAPKGIPAAKSR